MINGISSSYTSALTTQVNSKKEEDTLNGFQDALNNAMESGNDEEKMKACKEVESYFLSTIFKQMKDSLKISDPYIPKGEYEEKFEDMLIDEQCKSLTDSGGIGIAEMMYKQMTKMQ